ncbi:zinc finger BED domain-containing protein RICESLEEPER 2-like [Rhizophagus clarus]|uniref:Zinc finger BED domain-containing protein RICESLEEPER 2-like n=1 Tax=Rhizophagus clarus TaxID=94130 RepID=A0A8H3QJ03_9GLOM|nr:zinc finger BED domain-containing protein RICESLEEPER 2-like [Rhizophagus clarus]
MVQFDPSFVVPGEQKIKTMIVKSYQCNYENLKNILKETAITVFLTTDLWSSRAKHRYVDVIATWITSDFKVKDVMLEIKYAPSPHTADVVAELLYKCISSWGLNGCVTAIITDNDSNMKVAFPILTQKDQCKDIQRHSCVAYILQLSIGKGLAPVEILATDLYTSTNREDRKDGNKLKKIMLADDEWNLLDQLVDILIPFEKAT